MNFHRIRTARVCAVVAVVSALAVAGCGAKSPTGPQGSGGGAVPFYTSARRVSPVFVASAAAPSARAMPLRSQAWDPGNPVRTFFDLLRNFEHPADEGRVDSHNLYKVLFDAGNMFAGFRTDTGSTALPSPLIASTFDFGTGASAHPYGGVRDMVGGNGVHYHHSWAFRVEGTVTHALLTWNYDESVAHQEHGAIEASLDEATGDIELHMANFVWYSDTSWFSIRTWVAGNTNTHAFALKGLNRNQHPFGGSCTSFAGAGVSQGADEYFLFKLREGAGALAWYKIPAAANEDSLLAMPQAGFASIEPGQDPRGYLALVPAALFLESDGADSFADFANGNTLVLHP